ncbi:CBS domain-containing protein [Anaeromyxobacter oryzae]|nr:CBS domain-containing protein [Anaeromyxobacter oryzae]
MPGKDPLAPRRAILADLAAGDVMTRPAISVEPATPLVEVVVRMAAARRRALPVVMRGFVVGIVTQSDVVARGTGAAVEPGEAALGPGDAEHLVERIARSGRVARDVMTPEPVTVGVAMPLREAAELMARRRLKRLPVVDAAGRLAGVLSRVDVLRAVAGGGWEANDAVGGGGLDAGAPLGDVMRPDPPAVRPETPLEDVLPLVAASGLDHALVVDADRRVLGAVSDAALLERLAPPVRRGVFSASLHGLPFGHLERERAERRAVARTAADVLGPVATAAPDLPLHEAIALVLPGAHKLLAVVDAEGRLVGALDRAALLRGLLPANP